ncbi:uncharacterized protein TNIN_403301 [Trichonephila inaurata madagascariensis]|uniref:Uncharacterized protein n=1 Tax=Trichonephila inaurata madagascariensis TaxID=2747483 RepID=A0A8X6XFB3_9ARAC|nr:uncharacterized protein TNIN_403301 [Trichonephila inaurata madagascariensis]
MESCYPRECDHHCAQVCQQYFCPCDYTPGYTPISGLQKACCKWELISPISSKANSETSHPIKSGDVLTRYFGVQRSWRSPHDPIRFTGVNHIPKWLHTDLSTLDVDYSNILKEREVMAAAKQTTLPGYYQFKSIRPYNKTNHNWYNDCPRDVKLYHRESDKNTEKAFRTAKISSQGLSNGQMVFLS